MKNMRQCIGGNHQARGMKDLRIKKQKSQRRRQKHQARQTIEEMQHCVEVAQALAQVQALAEQRIVGAENLRHTPRPANTLANVA